LVATFAAKNPAIGKPAHVHAARHGRRLTVTWGAAFLAARYDVVVALSNGERLAYVPKGTARRITIGGVPSTVSARVQVIAIGTGGGHGPAAVTTLKTPKKHRHR
jgi:hypothetical protein